MLLFQYLQGSIQHVIILILSNKLSLPDINFRMLIENATDYIENFDGSAEFFLLYQDG